MGPVKIVHPKLLGSESFQGLKVHQVVTLELAAQR
jgi:hypothetical protein